MNKGRLYPKKVAFIKKTCNKRVLQTLHQLIQSQHGHDGEWKTPAMTRMLARARRDIGYSDKTNDIDIANALYKLSRSACR